MRIAFLALAGALLLCWVVVEQRHWLFFQAAKLTGGQPPPLMQAVTELPSTIWFDDYYTVDEIAPDTYAIGEPRYPQQNYNYLIVGAHTALLFDAGPGVRDIRPVVESLTDLPIIFLPSHFHYDHVGNGVDFAQRAVVDLPYLRDRAEGNTLTFTGMEHLGPIEGFSVPTWQIDHWWAPGETIDLGGRKLTIVHTPGHSRESISLYDPGNDLMLSGDFLYEGPLFVFVPGSSVQDYLSTTQQLLETYAETVVYFGAHRATPPGPPQLGHGDLADLEAALLSLRSGELPGSGLWPREFVINERMTLLADPRFLQDW